MFRYGFKKRLQELGVDYGASVLAAVSGGVDSMCMVDALLHSQLDLQVAVAHVNFNLRGEESDADTRMVEQWCTEHNITLYQESFNTTEFAQQEGISIEMAARDLRYNWFYTLMQEHGFNFLAIAHNANDNAETLLLNLTRGCGIEGIAGIREKVLLQFQEEQEEQQAKKIITIEMWFSIIGVAIMLTTIRKMHNQPAGDCMKLTKLPKNGILCPR